ncbi:MAG: hypothetical protein L3J53_08980 [Proteobacteria bacterium]|nr:hypothetical protein [Pseudomonadota bacterium]
MKTIIILLILTLAVSWYFIFYTPKPYKQMVAETAVAQTAVQQAVANDGSQAWVDFSIDNFNKTITLHGIVGNQKELDDIMQNFASTHADKSISHDITIDARLRSTDFALNLSLLLAVITDVKVAEVKFTAKQIELKGLTLDKQSETQTMLKLQQLFADEFVIVNNLELVFKDNTRIKDIKFELSVLPELP